MPVMRGPNLYMDGMRVTVPARPPSPKPKPKSKTTSKPKTTSKKTETSKSYSHPKPTPTTPVATPARVRARPDVDIEVPRSKPTSKPTSHKSPSVPISRTSLQRAVSYVKRRLHVVPDVVVPTPKPSPKPKPKSKTTSKPKKVKSPVSKPKGLSKSMISKVASLEAKRWNAMARAYSKSKTASKPKTQATFTSSTKKLDVTLNDLASNPNDIKAITKTLQPSLDPSALQPQNLQASIYIATQTDSTAVNPGLLKQWQEQAVIQGMKEEKERLKKGDFATTFSEAYMKYSPWSTVSGVFNKIVEKVTGEKDDLSPEAIREKKLKEYEELQKTQIKKLEQKRKKIEEQKKKLEAQAKALQMMSKRLQQARKFVEPTNASAVTVYNDEVMIANLSSKNLQKQYENLQQQVGEYNQELNFTQSQLQKLKEDIDALSPVTYKDVGNKAAYLLGGLTGVAADIGAGVIAGGAMGAAAGSEAALKAGEGASKLYRLIRDSEKLAKIASPIKRVASPIAKGLSKIPGKEKIVSGGTKVLKTGAKTGKWLLTDSKGQVVFLGAMEAPSAYAGYKAGLPVADIALHAGKDIGFGIGFAKGFEAGFKETPAAYEHMKKEVWKKYSRHYLPYEKETVGNSEVFRLTKFKQGTSLEKTGVTKNTLLARTTEVHTPSGSSIATKSSNLRIFTSVAEDGTPIVKAIPIEKELTIVRAPSKYLDDMFSRFKLSPRTSPLTRTMPMNDAFTLNPTEALIPKTKVPEGAWDIAKEIKGVKRAFNTFKPKTPETVLDFNPKTIKKVTDYKVLTPSVEKTTFEIGKSAMPLSEKEQEALRKMFSFKVTKTSEIKPKTFGKPTNLKPKMYTELPHDYWTRLIATNELDEVMKNPFSISRTLEPPVSVDYWEASRVVTKGSPIEKYASREIENAPESLEFWTRYGSEGPGKLVPREVGSIRMSAAPDAQKGWVYQLNKGKMSITKAQKLSTPGEQFQNYLATGSKRFNKPYSIIDRTTIVDRVSSKFRDITKAFRTKIGKFGTKFKSPGKALSEPSEVQTAAREGKAVQEAASVAKESENADEIAAFLERINGKAPRQVTKKIEGMAEFKPKTAEATEFKTRAPGAGEARSGSEQIALLKQKPEEELMAEIVQKGTTTQNMGMRLLRQGYKSVEPLSFSIVPPIVPQMPSHTGLTTVALPKEQLTPYNTIGTPQVQVPKEYIDRAKEMADIAKMVKPQTPAITTQTTQKPLFRVPIPFRPGSTLYTDVELPVMTPAMEIQKTGSTTIQTPVQPQIRTPDNIVTPQSTLVPKTITDQELQYHSDVTQKVTPIQYQQFITTTDTTTIKPAQTITVKPTITESERVTYKPAETYGIPPQTQEVTPPVETPIQTTKPPSSTPLPPEETVTQTTITVPPFMPDFFGGGGGGDIAPPVVGDSGAFGFWVGVTPFLGGLGGGSSKKTKKKESPLDKLIEDYIIWLLKQGFPLDVAQKIAVKVISEMLKKKQLVVAEAKHKASISRKVNPNVPLKKQSIVRARPIKDMALIKMRGSLL